LHGIISWTPNGNAFQVHKKDESCLKVLTTYFERQTKFTSFTRQVCFNDVFASLSRMTPFYPSFYSRDFRSPPICTALYLRISKDPVRS
jgi:hypothetical protein